MAHATLNGGATPGPTLQAHPTHIREEYELRLKQHEATEGELRLQLAGEDILRQQMAELVSQQESISHESDHRLINCLQIVLSLLSMQTRAATDPEVAAQLTIAANRVSTIERVHRRLHRYDNVRSVAFKPYLEDMCRDFTGMFSTETKRCEVILERSIDLNLPSVTAIPLGFIVNELITNACKYGEGKITVALDTAPDGRHALSVSNDGPPLPADFDPTARKGLGMRIVRSLADRISGELQFGPATPGQGARFTVLFA